MLAMLHDVLSAQTIHIWCFPGCGPIDTQVEDTAKQVACIEHHVARNKDLQKMN